MLSKFFYYNMNPMRDPLGDLHYRFELTLGRRLICGLMAAGMVLAAAPELDSEDVTLSTYYPAPSGVYTTMTATGDTILTRDAGSGLSVGTAVPPAAGMSMTVMGGLNVGIGLTDAQSALSVAGGVQLADDLDACLPAKVGTERWHLGNIEVCSPGNTWIGLGQSVYSCPEVWFTPGCDECTNSCVGQLQLGQTCEQMGAFGNPVANFPCALVAVIPSP